jgi:FKBP-type peptidyl-prolyl cis-trans isomerase
VNHKALLAVAVLVAIPLAVPAAEPAASTESERILYTIGFALSRSLANYDLTTSEIAVVQQGLTDGILGKEPATEIEDFAPKIEDYLAARRAVVLERARETGLVFLTGAEQEENATKLESGMVYVVLEAGDGAQPSETDVVKIEYHGTLTDGTVFDTSRVEGGVPATFSLTEVVPCFAEGVSRMNVGGKSKLVCPPELAYGDRGFPPRIPPGATLTFEIELLEIVADEEPETPTP